MQALLTIAWIAGAFICGALPFSVWIGRLSRGVDIRQYGDFNPGATNVLRAAGTSWAIAALLLDYFKAAVPVGLAWFVADLKPEVIFWVALAPVAGHAFSPFLDWRGGKAVAATFGIWSGLTVGAGPLILGLLLGAMFGVFETSGWAVLLAFGAFGVYIGCVYGQIYPFWLAIWAGNLAILWWKHRAELAGPPAIRDTWLRWVACVLHQGRSR